jgi:hypothetical protein
MAFKSIKLKNYSDVIEEYAAGGTIYPGMLLLLNSSNAVIAHSDDAPANCLPMFALEDSLQGKGIDDTYASGDRVQCWIPGRGDQVLAILEDGADIDEGDFLESNGAGYLQKYTSGAVVGVALETLDLSGSSGEETSESPLGFNKRIKVRIC